MAVKMQPYGPLMVEHRLIERMVALMKKELERIEKEKAVDTDFIISAAEFLRNYADKCHHGKEEDILFRSLLKKPISPEDKKMIDGFLSDHVLARKTVKDLLSGKDDFVSGNKKAVDRVIDCLKRLTELYPAHIAREDRQFFIPCMRYFSDEEKAKMVEDFANFDRTMDKSGYEKLVLRLEGL